VDLCRQVSLLPITWAILQAAPYLFAYALVLLLLL
jgi:hypothetical protein